MSRGFPGRGRPFDDRGRRFDDFGDSRGGFFPGGGGGGGPGPMHRNGLMGPGPGGFNGPGGFHNSGPPMGDMRERVFGMHHQQDPFNDDRPPLYMERDHRPGNFEHRGGPGGGGGFDRGGGPNFTSHVDRGAAAEDEEGGGGGYGDGFEDGRMMRGFDDGGGGHRRHSRGPSMEDDGFVDRGGGGFGRGGGGGGPMDDRRRFNDGPSPAGMGGRMSRDRSPYESDIRGPSPSRVGGKFPPPPPPPPPESAAPPGVQRPVIYKTLDPLSDKSSPLIGLHHMYEHQTTGQPPRYECRLCKALIKDSTIFLKHANGEHHKRKYIQEFYMNYEFTMKTCNNKKEQKEMLEEFVIEINETEGKKYVNLVLDGEEVDWAKKLREDGGDGEGGGGGGGGAADATGLMKGDSSSSRAVADEAEAKVTSTSELERREDVSNADVEAMLSRVVNPRMGGGGGGVGMNDRFLGTHGTSNNNNNNSINDHNSSTHPSDITSSDQSPLISAEVNNVGNSYNGNQRGSVGPPHQQQQQLQQQSNGDDNNPLKNILLKKHMKILPVPPPHPPPPPPQQNPAASSPFPPPAAAAPPPPPPKASQPSLTPAPIPPPVPVGIPPPPPQSQILAPLEVLQAMTVMVTTEEEARMALQVAQALTQAVYRFRQQQFHLSHSANGRP